MPIHIFWGGGRPTSQITNVLTNIWYKKKNIFKYIWKMYLLSLMSKQTHTRHNCCYMSVIWGFFRLHVNTELCSEFSLLKSGATRRCPCVLDARGGKWNVPLDKGEGIRGITAGTRRSNTFPTTRQGKEQSTDNTIDCVDNDTHRHWFNPTYYQT